MTSSHASTTIARLVLSGAFAALLASASFAQAIADRASLDVILVPNQRFEDFESYVVITGGAADCHSSDLHALSQINGQGPGLVLDGAEYSSPTGAPLYWNGDQFYGLSTRTVESTSPTLRIDYTLPTQAVGFDITNYEDWGFNGAVDFHGPGGLLGTVFITLDGSANHRVFAGWQDAGGIVRAELQDFANTWSPLIDDHGFGIIGTPGAAYCFGDATGSSCPCSAFGGIGEGCANTSGFGATLVAHGFHSFSDDTLELQVDGVPGNKPGLLLRGDNQVALPVGDGILCTSGNTLRSQVQVTSAGTMTFTDFAGGPFGSVANVGAPTNFQCWYRDPSNPCSGAGFNFTNAWEVTYLP